MKKIFQLTFFVSSFVVCYSQIEKRNMFPTPNAASLGVHGQIPVDYFTGQADISIPLYTYVSGDLSVPIGLSYHTSNIKPSDHSSWVGLGWGLSAGGVITRIQNDIPDEFVDYDHPGPGSLINREKRGFFYNYSYLGDNNWLTTTIDKEARAFFHTGIANSDWFDENMLYRRDLAPDEFQFNFLGFSGSFLMAQDGLWKLKGKQGIDYAIELILGQFSFQDPTSNPNSSTLIKSCIKGFILTGPDGTKYTFGNTTSSIEFVRTYSGTITSGSRDGGTLPKSWYLTKIKSRTGQEINFSYSRDGYQIMNSVTGSAYTYYCQPCFYAQSWTLSAGSDNVSILSGVSLSSINGSNGTIEFKKTRVNNILDYFIGVNQAWQDLQNTYYYEVFYGDGFNNPKSFFMKLDDIEIKDNTTSIIKSFHFTYTENSNNRLFLSTITQKASDNSSLPPYTFTYNNIAGLANIPYETNKVDHWGYFNGVNPFTGITFPDYNLPPNSPSVINLFDVGFATTYKNNRAPNSDNMKVGVLTQINYPEGGNTQFIWEPNYYSKIIDQTPVASNFHIDFADLNTDIIGPGLRIKKIINQAGLNAPELIKEYFYKRDYVNSINTSSGVLNSSEPKYVNTYSITLPDSRNYRVWSSNNRVPLHYTNGAPITYSRVQEVNQDGSFNEYVYSNHDNGYLDNVPELAVVTSYGNSLFQEFTTNSKELERGLLLEQSFYRNNSPGFSRLKWLTFLYNDDASRFNSNIRKYAYENKFTLNGTIINWQELRDGSSTPYTEGNAIFTGANLWALRIYTYYPFLKSRTEINYDQSGANPVTTVQTFTYDNLRNVKTETLTSSNGQLTNTYNYPADNISGLSSEALTAKNTMNASHIFPVLEKVSTRDNQQTNVTRTNYKVFENGNTYILPANVQQSFGNNSLVEESQYVNYDPKGNILQFNTRNNIPNSFQWDYNQSYPTVKIVNAANTLRTYTITTITSTQGYIIYYPGQFYTQSANFTHAATGNISLSLAYSGYPGSTTNPKILNYTLSGPQTHYGTICLTNTGSGCSYPSSTTFANMPSGQYTITVTLNSNYGTPGVTVTYSYLTTTIGNGTDGIKEFFYEGFEINGSGIANPYAGKKYYSGDYQVLYSKPNSRNYKVNYHYLENGSWKNRITDYTNNMILAEGDAIDEVRVYPSDALMTTYTYDPLIGMTSGTDPNGKTLYYEYDNFLRLRLVRDRDKNIVKQYEYKLQDAPCAADWQNTTTPIRCKQVNGQNTGEQEQEQKDMNACSLTYNTTRWTVIGTNTSVCPVTQMITIMGYNTKSSTYQVKFTNNATNNWYTFYLNPNTYSSYTLGQIPAGTYKVEFYPAGSPVSSTYNINGNTQPGTYGATFLNILINSTSTASMY